MNDIKADPAYMDGMEAFLIGDWTVAKDFFLLLDKHFPDNYYIIFILGNIFYSQGDLEKSIEYYKKTIALRKNFGNAYYKMGVSYFKMGKFNEALHVLKKLIQVEGPQHIMAYYYLGVISINLSQDEDAIEYFDKLRLASPQTKMAEFFEARLRIKRHEFEPARDLIKQFLNASPDFAEAHYLLGVAYMGMHKNMKALNSFSKALELNPDDKRSALKVDSLSTTDWP